MRSRTRLFIAACLVAAILAIMGCGAKKTAQAPAKASHATKKAESAKSTESKASSDAKAPETSSTNAASPAAPGVPSLGGLGDASNSFLGSAATGSAPSSLATAMAKAPGMPPPPAMKAVPQKPTAAQLIAVLEGVYGNIPTLRASGKSIIAVKADGKSLGKPSSTSTSILFKRPTKFILDNSEGRLICDGKTVYNYVPAAKQYIKNKFDNRVLVALAKSKVGVGVLGLLFRTNYAPAIASSKTLKDAKIGGRDTFVVSLRLKSGVACPKGVDATQTLWISKSDFCLCKNVLVLKYRPKPMKGMKGRVPKLVETTMTSTLSQFEPNIKLADSRFAFNPPSGVKPYAPPKPVDMSGKPAADFSFKQADGTVKKISDLKGKIVLLDFWALPMCTEHLPAVQSAYSANKDKVELVSINVNTNKAKVDEFMKKKGYTFPYSYADEQIVKTANTGYNIMGLPTMVVIDEKGIIRHVMIGLPTAKDIQAQIDKVLK